MPQAAFTRMAREDLEMKVSPALEFELPPNLEADTPPEARGLRRDGVRLMVSHVDGDRVTHSRFSDLGDSIGAGDVLVINTSSTIKAALPATREDGSALELHLSTHLPGDVWTVELRTPDHPSSKPFFDAAAGETLSLLGGARATLHAPYSRDRSLPLEPPEGRNRLWLSTLENLPLPPGEYTEKYGAPIRYGHVGEEWSIGYYRTVYATEPGSAEMPSAGRAFTPELITRLVASGVQFAPLLLHTGVSSLEDDEPPYEEYYRVPPETARLVESARERGNRVVAVGTTAVRALETTADDSGTVHPGEGWTDLVITPDRGLSAVNAMLTGLHEPRSSHLWMLEALAGRGHLRHTYAEALREGYLWHEFGDLHLMLP